MPRDVASMAVHKDTAADTSSICIKVTDAAPYSTAVHHAAPAAADQNSSSHAMIGIAGDALHRQKDTTAATAADANLELACVREPQPQQQPQRGCCSCTPKMKTALLVVAVLVIVAGTALGVGLRFGLLAKLSSQNGTSITTPRISPGLPTRPIIPPSPRPFPRVPSLPTPSLPRPKFGPSPGFNPDPRFDPSPSLGPIPDFGTSPCSGNPCSGVKLSTGFCSVEIGSGFTPGPGLGYTCGCVTGLRWDKQKRSCV